MYNVSEEYLTKIKADSRRVYGKIQIDYTDPFLDQSINMTANENANVSYPQQTADSVLEPLGKILSLDGSCNLDGSYILAPYEDLQMGWWGSQLAGVGGVLTSPYPTLTAVFLARPIASLKVVGDSARVEYPVDFTIKLYDSADTLLHTETVTDNSLVIWNKTLATITQVTKMALEITKWSHVGRQCKIIEFFTSIQEIYEGDDILMINLLEEKEVTQGSLPVGNISSNEIDIRLFNKNRKFDAGNSQSPLYQTLKQNRKIKAWLGILNIYNWENILGNTWNDITGTWLDVQFVDSENKEFVPLGTFWSGDWNVPEQDVYAQTTGRDRLELLRKSTYSTSQVFQNTNLFILAENVLEDAGLLAEDYYIDVELQDYIIPYSYFNPQSHREALRVIAEACIGQVYCDREGVIRIEGPSAISNIVETIITDDDYFNKDNPAKWSQVANYITLETQPLKLDVLQEVYKSNEPVNIGVETKTITAFYNNTPAINAVASITGTGTISSETYYAWGANIKVTSSSVGTFELTINAQPLKVLNKNKIIRQDEESIIDMGTLKYTFPDNPLVQTVIIAETIADKLLSSFKNPRRDIVVDWRGNPALLLGNKIKVADDREENEYNITSQNLEYDGTLSGRFLGRRA